MKIIQIMPQFGLAGAETMCENLSYELKKSGHNVIVLSMYDYQSPITERLEKEGIDVRYLGKKLGLDLSIIGKMIKIFKAEKPDVIHTHLYVMKYAIPAAIIAGVKKRVHTVHNIAVKENDYIARKINNIFYKMFRVIPVALSDLIRDSIVEEYRIKKERIPVVYNGVNLSKCIPKNEYSFEGNFIILHIGRFSNQKNHMRLVEGFYLFHQRYPNTELWLIGDGENKVKVEDYLKENGLVGSVKFLGLQKNVFEYLRKADIFTLPSDYEGFPMTLIEAMGTGLPIVATNVGGVPDMLNNESAMLIKKDVNELANAFEQYYNNEELRKKHGVNVLQQSRKFSAEMMAMNYCNIYESGR